MKTTKKGLLLLLGALAMTGVSCENFLKEEPYDFVSTDNFYRSEADAVTALNGVFNLMQNGLYYARTFWILSELTGDLMKVGNPQAGRPDLDELTYTSTNPEVANWWTYSYLMVNRANDVIANTPSISMDAARRANIEGNARFLRALAYFDLVRSYGDVPLLTKPTGADGNLRPARTPIKDVYKQIVDDLTFAEANCLPENKITAAEKGRVSSGAAASLLAKVYLTRAASSAAEATDTQSALDATNRVINSKIYSLVPYANVFDVATENGPEHIFSVQFDLPPNAGNITARMHLPASLDGNQAFYVEEWFYNSFAPADTIRKNWTMTKKAGSQTLANAYYVKFRDPLRQGNNARNNTLILRYADVLLMQSEAMNQLNPANAGKFDGINAVRTRAGISKLSLTTTPSKEDFITALVDERGWEFSAEGIRRFDLLRLGRYKEVQKRVYNRTVDDKYLLYPIPQTEITLNPNLTQNPGF
ncbi:RagB/SusD family nutrient uptake outer membrane protein [Spirosoma sp. RP8]|uniref:RagB/SusD family nutrient uptake outer membrane protein n=1 Tax=Spirosoma liriopis TaxID=2937440 RepID=A0ABT0HSH3_9BACT|nr:RagB/SusD family nutrient uptake outer membrane protein [Spirosoma liriopis]MCK8494935.1 RagB/SusD family nutrient uptake outer membrane protein [Spirosoma liriopis]